MRQNSFLLLASMKIITRNSTLMKFNLAGWWFTLKTSIHKSLSSFYYVHLLVNVAYTNVYSYVGMYIGKAFKIVKFACIT